MILQTKLILNPTQQHIEKQFRADVILEFNIVQQIWGSISDPQGNIAEIKRTATITWLPILATHLVNSCKYGKSLYEILVKTVDNDVLNSYIDFILDLIEKPEELPYIEADKKKLLDTLRALLQLWQYGDIDQKWLLGEINPVVVKLKENTPDDVNNRIGRIARILFEDVRSK
ncbi:MAG: hypothetical protein ABIH39_07165 [Candidatus Margulisiibacteriota bacterium]